jgi:hypothetical protein
MSSHPSTEVPTHHSHVGNAEDNGSDHAAAAPYSANGKPPANQDISDAILLVVMVRPSLLIIRLLLLVFVLLFHHDSCVISMHSIRAH